MKKINQTALCAVLAAAGVVLLYIGSLFGKIDLAAAVIASVAVAIAALETGYRRSLFVYATISLLSLLLLPQKTAAIVFSAFFGYYPVLKMWSEKHFGFMRSFFLKYLFLNAAVLSLLIAAALFVKVHIVVMAAVWAASNLILPIYDMAVSSAWKKYEDRFNRK